VDFHKWTKIFQFHNVRKLANKMKSDAFQNGDGFDGKFLYRGKVKLDGTNASVRMCNGELAVQSRGRIITPADDNYGFAKWVDENESFFRNHMLMIESVKPNYDITLYGEWIGTGIQKRTSASQIGKRAFCLFALRNHVNDSITVEPSILEVMFASNPDIYIIPWSTQYVSIDWNSTESVEFAAQDINKLVIDCGKCDEFVKDKFAVEGLGEGFVFYPMFKQAVVDYNSFREWMFKAKGEEHQTQKQTKPVIVDPEALSSRKAFVTKFLTPVRLEQALNEIGEASRENTGAFLKWVGNDIRDEGADELEASGIEWKSVAKSIANEARFWWIDKCNNT